MSDEMEALQAQIEKNLGLGQRLIDKPTKPAKPPKVEGVPTLVVAGESEPKSEVTAASARAMKNRNPDGTKKTKLKVPKLNINKPDEAALIKKYPHATPGTLHYSASDKKWTVNITCEKCRAQRAVHTSDLFQVKLCKACKGAKTSKPAETVEQKVENIKALAQKILKQEGS